MPPIATHLPEMPRSVRPQADIDRLFAALLTRWHADTDVYSDMNKKVMHPAYQQIIGLGLQAVPPILKELDAHGGHWFCALTSITGENPVAPEEAGRFDNMKEAGLRWGNQKEFIWTAPMHA